MAVGINGLGQVSYEADSARTGDEKKTGISFLELAKRRYAGEDREVSQASKPGSVGAVSRTELEQYKQYIYDWISRIPIPVSRMQENISVTITDSGFEAMRQNSEYEEWVLNSLYENLSADYLPGAVRGGGGSFYYYGAVPEEYRKEEWRSDPLEVMDEQDYLERIKKSFWQRRIERHERYMEAVKTEGKKRQLHREQDLREAIARPGRKKDAYLSGVSAAELLSALA